MINKPKNGKKRKANANITTSAPKIVKLDTSDVTEEKIKPSIKNSNNNVIKNKNNKQTVKLTPKVTNGTNLDKPQKKDKKLGTLKPNLNGNKSSDNENTQKENKNSHEPLKKKNKRRKKKAAPSIKNNDDSSDDEADVKINLKPQVIKNTKVAKTENEADGSSDEADTSAKITETTPKKKKNRRKKKKAQLTDNTVTKLIQKEQKPNKTEAVKPKSSDEDSDEEMPSIIMDNKGDVSDDSESEQSDDNDVKSKVENGNADAISEKYPILKDQKLIESFLNVPVSNNQKGRIRQALVQKYKDVPKEQKPDIINSRIQAMLTGTEINDSQLRRIRILYNMLKESLKSLGQNTPNLDLTRVKPKRTLAGQKGPKRYVVFVGNLPLGTQKERLMNHFDDLSDHIKDIRVPVTPEGKKRSIAYIEMDNEASYELALSKNHTMLDNRRIKVEYSVQKNSKISKTDAKGKSAKLSALQKSGKLIGSVPLEKKRSQRRKKMKTMRAAAEAE